MQRPGHSEEFAAAQILDHLARPVRMPVPGSPEITTRMSPLSHSGHTSERLENGFTSTTWTTGGQGPAAVHAPGDRGARDPTSCTCASAVAQPAPTADVVEPDVQETASPRRKTPRSPTTWTSSFAVREAPFLCAV